MSPEQLGKVGQQIQQVGAVTDAIGGYAYNSASARNAAAEARSEALAGRDAAGRIQQQTTRAIGEARGAYSASGASLTSGSALAVEGDIGRRGELDAMTAVLNSDLRAAAKEQEASDYRTAAVTSAAGSLLRSGASSIDNMRRWRGTRAPSAAFDLSGTNRGSGD